MPFTTAIKNSMLDGLSPTHVSLHTADPGQTGTSEVSGGGYARGSASFNAASAGVRQMASDVTMNVPGSTTVTHGGVWATATFLGSIDLTDEVFASAGQYKLLAASTSLTIT